MHITKTGMLFKIKIPALVTTKACFRQLEISEDRKKNSMKNVLTLRDYLTIFDTRLFHLKFLQIVGHFRFRACIYA